AGHFCCRGGSDPGRGCHLDGKPRLLHTPFALRTRVMTRAACRLRRRGFVVPVADTGRCRVSRSGGGAVPRLTIFAAVRRAIAGVRRRPAADAEALPELEDSDWLRHTGQLIDARFWVIARRLPALVRQALGLAWRASRVDTAVAIGLNVVAGLLTAFGLLATRGVLQALFTAGPTAGRVRAAVPALILVAAATAARAGLSIAAGFAQARLEPQLNRVVERRLFEITSRVELAAFDDAGMADDMDRARRRGLVAVRYLV